MKKLILIVWGLFFLYAEEGIEEIKSFYFKDSLFVGYYLYEEQESLPIPYDRNLDIIRFSLLKKVQNNMAFSFSFYNAQSELEGELSLTEEALSYVFKENRKGIGLGLTNFINLQDGVNFIVDSVLFREVITNTITNSDLASFSLPRHYLKGARGIFKG